MSLPGYLGALIGRVPNRIGGALTALYMPDRDGVMRDVVPGWREPEAYLTNLNK